MLTNMSSVLDWLVDLSVGRWQELSCTTICNFADDSSRVVLSVPNTSGTDYINASFVNVSNADTAYITYTYNACMPLLFHAYMRGRHRQ